MEQIVVDVLEGMDRKAAERTITVAPDRVDPERREAVAAEEFKRKTGLDMSALRVCETKTAAKLGQLKQIDDLKSGLQARIIARFNIIKAHDELYLKAKNLSVCLNSPKRSVRLQAAQAMYSLLDRTNAIAGWDWRKPEPQRLVFT